MNNNNVNEDVLKTSIEENDELQHWGIKGMKWGRRRFQNNDGSLTPAGQKRYADDNDHDSKSDEAKDHDNLRRKGVSGMSNAELKRYSERARLENDVHNAQQQEQQRTSKMRNIIDKMKVANDFLGNVARMTASVRAISSNTQALYKDGKAATDWFKNRNKKDVDVKGMGSKFDNKGKAEEQRANSRKKDDDVVIEPDEMFDWKNKSNRNKANNDSKNDWWDIEGEPINSTPAKPFDSYLLTYRKRKENQLLLT